MFQYEPVNIIIHIKTHPLSCLISFSVCFSIGAHNQSCRFHQRTVNHSTIETEALAPGFGSLLHSIRILQVFLQHVIATLLLRRFWEICRRDSYNWTATIFQNTASDALQSSIRHSTVFQNQEIFLISIQNHRLREPFLTLLFWPSTLFF